MSNYVSYNTENMREWASNVANCAGTYSDNISKLYQEVESFIGNGFTGGLADEFLLSFQDKKKYFIDNKDFIEECANYLSDRANKIETSEEDLMNQIKNDSYFNN